MMGYQSALEAAGWDVHAFERFGCYSGTWCAIVSRDGGEREVITDWYGSCTLCDSYEAEFDYNEPEPDKLREFGERYTALPFEHELARLHRICDDEREYFSSDDEELLGFLTANRS